MALIKYLLGLLVVMMAVGQTTDIKPTCNTPIVLSTLPVALQETQILEMDDFISGFNLQLEAHDQPDYVTLSDKFAKKAGRAVSQPGLKGYHIDYADNSWGTNFITISEVNFTTTVRWGKLSATESIPDITG